MNEHNSPKRRSFSIRDLIIGVLGGGACMVVVFGVGLVINSLFPPDGPAYAGIGLDARNLPGTILGLLTWVGIVLVFANPFRKD